MNLLEENRGANICDLDLDNGFWDFSPQELTKKKNR